MLYLVIGGSGSGKSEFAEGICMDLSKEEKLYIATMQPFGKEGEKRIARHRKLRAGKGFETLECYTHLEDVKLEKPVLVLLECMSNLVANEYFAPEGRKELSVELIPQGVKGLLDQTKDVVIVTNDVYCDGIQYDEMTDQYMKGLARINTALAGMADQVWEVVCGIPVLLKDKMEQK